MCDSYARSLLRVSVAQICQALGWDAVQVTACDLLSDVLHRYIQQLARGCHRYSELYGRTDPMVDDVGQAFGLLGVNLNELEDYVNNLEPVLFAHQTSLFPVTKNNVLQFPQPGCRDAEERKEYILDYMPPIVSLQEEEEEQVFNMGTSAEAMQVPLDEEEEEMEDEEAVNDENYPAERHLDSPDSMDLMPAAKRPRLPGVKSSDSPDWAMEPREPLSSLNPQWASPPPQSSLHSHDSSGSPTLSPDQPGLVPSSRTQTPAPWLPDPKRSATPSRKPKAASSGPASGSPVRLAKASRKERKKSPGRNKSPKSPRSPKLPAPKVSHPPGKGDVPPRPPMATLSEQTGKENVHLRQTLAPVPEPKKWLNEMQPAKPEPPDTAIDDSIAAVIAKVCAERGPDLFTFFSAPSSSPPKLTISEAVMTKISPGASGFGKDSSTRLPPDAAGAPAPRNSWTMDDSIDEVIRKVNQGAPSGSPPNPRYLSSPSASPPTPEPLLKVYEEKNKLAATAETKKKPKKELKAKVKKREKEKQKEKGRERDKGKNREKNRERNREKNRDEEAGLPWKDTSGKEGEQREHAKPRDLFEPDAPRTKPRDSTGGSVSSKKEKERDKKKDREKSRKDKEKREKGKDKAKASLLGLKETPVPLFSPSICLRKPILLPLTPILTDRLFYSKDRKKEKKEKRKKKDKEKEKEKAKEKEEKKKREKEKEKERHKLEKVKAEPPAVAPSPVIPRLTLRVGAGQDKIVISKVVPTPEVRTPVPKTSAPKTPTAKFGPASHPWTPPPASILTPVPPPATPAPLHPATASPAPTQAVPLASSSKIPVRSVVTETVSAYVVRDEWGNQIWICPGCKKADDGSPMIGCDGCDDWYHWPCVGLFAAPPEDVSWFCVKCDGKKKDKKHKKRKHKVH